MSVNIALCGTMCGNLFGNLSIPSISFCHKKNNKNKKIISQPSINVKRALGDVNELLNSEKFDRKYILIHILNKMIQITGSEYGFIGQVVIEEKSPVLFVHAITNIAWDKISEKFFSEHMSTSLKFENMETLFGDVITTGKYKITNTYDQNRNIIPHGHPIIKRFMGVPSMLGDRPVAIVGLCNKLTKYTKKDAVNVSSILDALSYLFIEMTRISDNTMVCPLKDRTISDDKMIEE